MICSYQIHRIGSIIRRTDEQSGRETVTIEIDPQFAEGLLGIEDFSHIEVYYWFDRNDTPQQRATLRVHPRKDPSNPLTGVFATHSPVRPNLIARSVCRLLKVEGTRLTIESIDALEDSPLIDIKGYMNDRIDEADLRLPRFALRASRGPRFALRASRGRPGNAE